MSGAPDNELDKYINDLSGMDDHGNAGSDITSVPDDSGSDHSSSTPNDAVQVSADNTQGQTVTDKSTQTPDAQAQAPKLDAQGKPIPERQVERLTSLGDGVFANQKGDITDKDGNIVAQGGFAARMFQQNRRMKSMLDERSEQLSQISMRVGELSSLSKSMQSYGLDADDAAMAFDIAGRMKRGDDIGAAKQVLALIAAKGYNVTDLLGGEVGDTIELKAINQMIEQRLAPITRQEQGRQQNEQVMAAARANYNRFVADNDHADIHANTIAEIMNRDGIGAQQAYNNLREFAVSNGLDFGQDLKPQIIARQQAAAAKRSGVKPVGNSGQKPMPNGAATRGNGVTIQVAEANADDDWGTIIRGVQQAMGGHLG
jgi:hypothetical protein